MTLAQLEALRLARYAIDRVIQTQMALDGEVFPGHMRKVLQGALDEIDEAIPPGDEGDQPIKITLGGKQDEF